MAQPTQQKAERSPHSNKELMERLVVVTNNLECARAALQEIAKLRWDEADRGLHRTMAETALEVIRRNEEIEKA